MKIEDIISKVMVYGLDESIFESIDISISHCREYAVAYVVALQRS